MIYTGNCLDILPTLPAQSVHCCVTSPPYWGLRDYGHADQLGNERTPAEYVQRMVQVFREVKRVLRDDGTVFVNLGDTYGSGKQLTGIPWRVAFALQDDDWILRQDIIWHKPNPMPESVQDRCTKAHEYVFLLTKQPRYYYDAEAVKEENSPTSKMGGVYANDSKQTQCGNGHSGIAAEGKINIWAGRNRRSVWTVTTSPYKGAHFATMPPKLVEPCILAGCPAQVCPSCGAGLKRMVSVVNSIGRVDKSGSDGFVDYGMSRGRAGSAITDTIGWQPTCNCGADQFSSGVVLDPFAGSGTTGAVATSLGRNFVGIELNPAYVELAEERIGNSQPALQFEAQP